MNIEVFREYCLLKPGVSESLPFGPDALVFKVSDKMFALLSLTGDPGGNLKCDPDWAIELREQYSNITPGYHMSKKHWNTVALDGSLPSKLIKEMIDHSYDLVYGALSKKKRDEINGI